jgi:hypothetical protein
METKGKLANNWKKEMWKSIDEDDVMQLRSKLNDIQIQTENELQSYNMNSAEEFET